MTAIAATSFESRNPALIAPRWHTALLTTLFLGLAISGALFQREAGVVRPRPEVIPVYLSVIAMQAVLVLAVWQGGLRRKGTSLSGLIGGRWTSRRDLIRDCGIAMGTWVVWLAFRMMWVRLLGPSQAASIQTLLPQGVSESLLWVGVSVSAGFSEELVFRGYFQRQFEIATRNPWLGLVLQAVLFGVSHGYQGMEACVKIAGFGVLFGLLAMWRRSLRPGMIAHAWSDIAGGIAGI